MTHNADCGWSSTSNVSTTYDKSSSAVVTTQPQTTSGAASAENGTQSSSSSTSGSSVALSCTPDVPSYAPPPDVDCMQHWTYNGASHCMCANPDSDAGGPWCFTDVPYQGRNWVYCSKCDSQTFQNYGSPTGCTCR